jgi:hypothetical protein
MAVGGSRKVRAARRRKRRTARVANDLTDAQCTALRDAWGGCGYFGAAGIPLERDCVLPISRGGRYTLGNVVPACRSCNTSKCSDEVTAWLRRKKLDERAFLLRYAQIRAVLDIETSRRSDPVWPLSASCWAAKTGWILTSETPAVGCDTRPKVRDRRRIGAPTEVNSELSDRRSSPVPT